MKNAPILYFVVPCYNEEEVLPLTAGTLTRKLDELCGAGKIDRQSRILLVDDGSRDRTWEMIEGLHREDSRFMGLKLSRNRGHQNALLAGLSEAALRCDAAISLDADLQDDVDACDRMIERFKAGCDIVYGVRKKRTTDSAFKRLTAESFYKMMNLLGANTVYNHADFRLMSCRALKGLEEFTEVNLFLRGIVPMIGYSSDVVYYDRKERAAGESKYPLGKMLAFAIEGITSLSIKPIRLITFTGIASFFVSIGFLIWAVVDFYRGNTISGWASIMVSIWFIGGLLLLSIGIVGEYIGKIYLETKHRPRYLVEMLLGDEESSADPVLKQGEENQDERI
ncbi:glycosyltransferase family 2 protein [Clostridium transplantifaecale]|uniref:glycosyltransferase family 2 protein n=1 Tax=Clostridium transplantifaecale TaxID=2479838 RepID=UPI000F635DC5|nr:glycosyltransferase family 2 protein [Clostridium transplantifaecale]